MPDTLYTNGKNGEMSEIIDFINYVFSQTAVPHDFKALLPKVYGDEAPKGLEGFHFLAMQQGKIVGCVACRPTELIFGDSALGCGYVGSVSVHCYHRGEGHMKRLMGDVTQSARARGMDMLILGGQRQRYEYFGFEPAGLKLNYYISKTNVRHALKDVDISDISFANMTENDVDEVYALWAAQPMRAGRSKEGFLLELRSWNTTPKAILENNELQGYLAGNELLLKDEKLLPKVVKSYISGLSDKGAYLSAALHQKDRAEYLSKICEHSSLGTVALINVLNWQNVLKTLLEFKHKYVSPIEDGELALEITGDARIKISVKGGKVEISKLKDEEGANLTLTHLQAQRLFFGVTEQFTGCAGIKSSWLGLPFYMSEQDAF